MFQRKLTSFGRGETRIQARAQDGKLRCFANRNFSTGRTRCRWARMVRFTCRRAGPIAGRQAMAAGMTPPAFSHPQFRITQIAKIDRRLTGSPHDGPNATEREETLFPRHSAAVRARRITRLVRAMDDAAVFDKNLLHQLFELGLMGIEYPSNTADKAGISSSASSPLKKSPRSILPPEWSSMCRTRS